jgi:hypothetical protein
MKKLASMLIVAMTLGWWVVRVSDNSLRAGPLTKQTDCESVAGYYNAKFTLDGSGDPTKGYFCQYGDFNAASR